MAEGGTIMGYMFAPLKRYADFKGRARRKEYWSWLLFAIIAMLVLMYLDTALDLGGTATGYAEGGSVGFRMTGGYLTMLFLLAIFVPSLAVAVRRIHDQDKTGWLILVPFYNVILMLLEGTAGPNRYGPDPKGTDAKVFA
jgi:uncharacterized membrane protein YhaH (DUF805 family)